MRGRLAAAGLSHAFRGLPPLLPLLYTLVRKAPSLMLAWDSRTCAGGVPGAGAAHGLAGRPAAAAAARGVWPVVRSGCGEGSMELVRSEGM